MHFINRSADYQPQGCERQEQWHFSPVKTVLLIGSAVVSLLAGWFLFY